MALFAACEAAAVVFTANDLVLMNGDNLVHVDSHTGDRTVFACIFDCDGPSIPGEGPDFGSANALVGFQGVFVTHYGSVYVAGHRAFSGGDSKHFMVIDVNPETGDRRYVSLACDPPDVCLPGVQGVGQGLNPWAAQFPAIGPPALGGVAALPSWGVPLVVGILLGVSIKLRHKATP
jgi:hypothetical protein